MKRIFRWATLEIVGIVLCISDLSAWQHSRNTKSVVVTEMDAGKTISVMVGASLEVRLASNPTTGYQWQATQTGAPCVQPIGRPMYQGPTAVSLGAGGNQVFRYQAVRLGTARLLFHYRRSWEPVTINTFVIRILVTR